LYSENIQAEPGEHVDMRFAIGPADTPDAARTIAEKLFERGLVESPPAPTAPVGP